MATQRHIRLILASGSPARRDIARATPATPFEVHARRTSTNRPAQGFTDPRHYVCTRSPGSRPPPSRRGCDEGLVLAADTVGWLDGQVIGKPADEADARRILTTLGGREHELWTGVVLWRRPDDVQIGWQECTRVFFTKLSKTELDAYLATDTWEGCSGAYAIQEKDDPFVRIVEGSVRNVIGLPMESLQPRVDELGVRSQAT